ncbi:MAG: hypothetical protein BAA01_08350 [Bacillus thermozeamaize]|uniref:Phosphatidate cytidylyltransferase n=1 Tax=Bacillus thermozeamaize TaxID=230954 RepID=A0A1Y3PLY3_9BACI|nr:MAG: hypothetical protein BAA01_08350 [Bacillus thermozeamaize]
MRKRIWTGLIGGTALLAFLYLGGIWYAVVIFGLAVFAYDEWNRLRRIPRLGGLYLIGAFFLFLFFIWASGLLHYHPVFLSLLVLLFMSLPVFTKNRTDVTDIAHVLLGLFYIGLGFSAMLATRLLESGLTLSLLLLLGTWANDTMAYLIGKRWGKNKLWPSISPNKTVEGSLAGVIASLLVSLLFSPFVPISTLELLVVGLLIGVAGQFGDLMESATKRSFQVKDTGWILPGHGGVLDRFDSLLVVFPLVYYILWYS